MTPIPIVEWVRKLPANSVTVHSGASNTAIRAAEKVLGLTFPAQMHDLYEYSDGLELLGKAIRLYLLQTEQIIYFQVEENILEDMLGVLLLGFDEGEYLFFTDTANVLKHGTGAIFHSTRGAPVFKYATFVATDLLDFLKKVLTDDNLFDLPFLFQTHPEFTGYE